MDNPFLFAKLSRLRLGLNGSPTSNGHVKNAIELGATQLSLFNGDRCVGYLSWVRDGKYKGKSGGKWVWTGEGRKKPRYQRNKPGGRPSGAAPTSETKDPALKEKTDYWGSDKQPYWRPGPNRTVDAVITRSHQGRKQVLLIKRGEGSAEAGKWALPGGFHDTDSPKGQAWTEGKESSQEAAIRELKEETGLDAKQIQSRMKHIGQYGREDRSTGRDPRDNDEAWAVTNAYSLDVTDMADSGKVSGMDDAADARWIDLEDLSNYKTAFDHGRILRQAGLLKAKVDPNPIAAIRNQFRQAVKEARQFVDVSAEDEADVLPGAPAPGSVKIRASVGGKKQTIELKPDMSVKLSENAQTVANSLGNLVTSIGSEIPDGVSGVPEELAEYAVESVVSRLNATDKMNLAQRLTSQKRIRTATNAEKLIRAKLIADRRRFIESVVGRVPTSLEAANEQWARALRKAAIESGVDIEPSKVRYRPATDKEKFVDNEFIPAMQEAFREMVTQPGTKTGVTTSRGKPQWKLSLERAIRRMRVRAVRLGLVNKDKAVRLGWVRLSSKAKRLGCPKGCVPHKLEGGPRKGQTICRKKKPSGGWRECKEVQSEERSQDREDRKKVVSGLRKLNELSKKHPKLRKTFWQLYHYANEYARGTVTAQENKWTPVLAEITKQISKLTLFMARRPDEYTLVGGTTKRKQIRNKRTNTVRWVSNAEWSKIEGRQKTGDVPVKDNQGKAVASDVEGFLSSLSPRRQQSAKASLQARMRIGGKVATRQEHVEELFSKGWKAEKKIKTISAEQVAKEARDEIGELQAKMFAANVPAVIASLHEKIAKQQSIADNPQPKTIYQGINAVSPDGKSFLKQIDITKTAIDYLDHLANPKDGQASKSSPVKDADDSVGSVAFKDGKFVVEGLSPEHHNMLYSWIDERRYSKELRESLQNAIGDKKDQPRLDPKVGDVVVGPYGRSAFKVVDDRGDEYMLQTGGISGLPGQEGQFIADHGTPIRYRKEIVQGYVSPEVAAGFDKVREQAERAIRDYDAKRFDEKNKKLREAAKKRVASNFTKTPPKPLASRVLLADSLVPATMNGKPDGKPMITDGRWMLDPEHAPKALKNRFDKQWNGDSYSRYSKSRPANAGDVFSRAPSDEEAKPLEVVGYEMRSDDLKVASLSDGDQMHYYDASIVSYLVKHGFSISAARKGRRLHAPAALVKKDGKTVGLVMPLEVDDPIKKTKDYKRAVASKLSLGEKRQKTLFGPLFRMSVELPSPLDGLNLVIENLAGDSRKPGWKPLTCDYGHIPVTEGADGESIDCFVADGKSETVHVVDQVTESGEFDEHKVVFGCESKAEAKRVYLSNYPKGWRCGKIRSMTPGEFRSWLAMGRKDEPIDSGITLSSLYGSGGALGNGRPYGRHEALAAIRNGVTRFSLFKSGRRVRAIRLSRPNLKKTGGKREWTDEDGREWSLKDGRWRVIKDAKSTTTSHGKRSDGNTSTPGNAMTLLNKLSGSELDKHADSLADTHNAHDLFWGVDRFDTDDAKREFIKRRLDMLNPKSSPRASASSVNDPNYIYARASDIPNAGVDLLGSARHKVNEWRGLDAAEKNGNAAELVTKANLLKNEPHNLVAIVDGGGNPMSALVGHYALGLFPSQPGASVSRRRRGYNPSDENATKDRRQYLEAYQAVVGEIERLTKESKPVDEYMKSLRKTIEGLILEFRGAESLRSYSAKDRYNTTANDLISLYNSLQVSVFGRPAANSVLGKMAKFTDAFKATYGQDFAKDADHGDKMAGHIKDILEGKSLNKTFGIQSGGRQKKFRPADLYVNKAERTGGRKLSAKTANKAVKYMTDKMGMRGVQWGNSVTDDERQHHAVKAAEAFLDLVDVLGLKDEDASLDGALGLAIGARGKGTALAHYEPSMKVINLTRKGGVGSLAHEWGHFWDNIVADGEYLSESQGRQHRKTAGGWEPIEDTPLRSSMRSLMQESAKPFKKRLSGVINDLHKNGILSDKQRAYWASGREIFARCFERYVEAKLADDGRSNTYLAGGKFGGSIGGDLWPNDEEVLSMKPAFDNLFDAYRKEK